MTTIPLRVSTIYEMAKMRGGSRDREGWVLTQETASV